MDWDEDEALSRSEKQEKSRRKLRKELGRALRPTISKTRAIANTFWGKAWCKNLESYADYEYRLARGRSYLRSGAILDLDITSGAVHAFVQGEELYTVEILFNPCNERHWQQLQTVCAGKVGSLLDLLAGELSEPIMQALIDRDSGLFPSPRQMSLSCNCLDVARVCKHLAAVLYAIGGRLDESPELLFTLRQADVSALIAVENPASLIQTDAVASLGDEDLGSLFGIDLVGEEPT